MRPNSPATVRLVRRSRAAHRVGRRRAARWPRRFVALYLLAVGLSVGLVVAIHYLEAAKTRLVIGLLNCESLPTPGERQACQRLHRGLP